MSVKANIHTILATQYPWLLSNEHFVFVQLGKLLTHCVISMLKCIGMVGKGNEYSIIMALGSNFVFTFECLEEGGTFKFKLRFL